MKKNQKPTKADIKRMAAQVKNELIEIEEIDAYECPECGKLYEDDLEADQCCPRDISTATGWKCPECDEIHDSEDGARECCGVPGDE